MKSMVNFILLVFALSFVHLSCKTTPNNATSIPEDDPLLLEEFDSSSYTLSGSGSGFFISNDGLIITCAHVVGDKKIITITLDGKEYLVEILATSPTTDLAVLRANLKNPFHFGIANFSDAVLGDSLSALGFPFSGDDGIGTEVRLTRGVVSTHNGFNNDPIRFQHDAASQPGNSGGPIINSNMQVIGINSAIANTEYFQARWGANPQNMNIAVKSENIATVLNKETPGKGNVTNGDEAGKATVLICVYEGELRNNTPPPPAPTTIRNAITFVNNTGYTGYYLYIRTAGANNWGSDLLGDSAIIRTGNSTNVSYSWNAGSRYDIRLVDSDGDSYIKNNVQLGQNSRIEFTLDDIVFDYNDSPDPGVTIINNTGFIAYYVYIRTTGTSNWGSDLLGSSIIRTGNSANVIYSWNNNSRYDILLVDSEGNIYEKTNIQLGQNPRIEFAASQSNNAVTISNKTGYAVFNVFIRRAGTTNWGSDLLGRTETIRTGNSANISYPWNSGSRYDILLVDSDGDSYQKNNIQLGSQIEFTIDDIDIYGFLERYLQ